MSIHQLQIAFDAVQDRLVLRVATTANEEIRAHLTRRFVREIWPHLMRVLNGHLGGAMPSSRGPAADQARGTTAPSASPSGRQAHPPAGQLAAVGGRMPDRGAKRGPLPPRTARARERSLVLDLDKNLTEVFCSMLRAAVKVADWDLTLDYDAPRPRPASPTTCSRRSSTSRGARPHRTMAPEYNPQRPPSAPTAHRGRNSTATSITLHDGGLGQAQHVFLAGNGLPERWQGPCPFRHRRDRFRPQPELPRHLGGVARRHAKRQLHFISFSAFRA